MASNFYKRYFIIFAVYAAIVLINRYLLSNALTNTAYGLFDKPGSFLIKSFSGFSDYARGILHSGFNFSKIINENDKVKSENQILTAQLVRLQKIELENQLLREQLAVSQRDQHQLLLAKVFSLNQNSLSSTLLIDKGSADGVKKSMAVISAGNVLVGTVREVFKDYSQVLLLDDSRSEISVKVGEKDVIANARGNSGRLILDLITNQESIKEGYLMVTSGLDYLPEFLLVGRVADVQLKGGNLFKGVNGELAIYPVNNPNLFVILK